VNDKKISEREKEKKERKREKYEKEAKCIKGKD